MNLTDFILSFVLTFISFFVGWWFGRNSLWNELKKRRMISTPYGLYEVDVDEEKNE